MLYINFPVPQWAENCAKNWAVCECSVLLMSTVSALEETFSTTLTQQLKRKLSDGCWLKRINVILWMFKYKRNSTDCANLSGARNQLRCLTFLCLLIKISVASIDNLEFIYSLNQDSQVNWFTPCHASLKIIIHSLFVCLLVS